MSWTRNPGRVVGFWYLLLVLGGPLRLIYIPNKLFVHDNAAATASNIAAHEWLFRFGMLSDLLGAVVLIFLVLAFYRLFKGVDQQLAVLLVITGGVMPALINFVNVVTDAGALMLAKLINAGITPPDQFRERGDRRRRAHARAGRRLPVRVRPAPAQRPGDAVPPAASPSDHGRGDPVGAVALPDGCPGIPVGLRAAVHRRVAVHQWRGLRAVEPHGDILPGIPEQGIHALPARPVRGVGDHAVARDPGRPAAGAGCRSLIAPSCAPALRGTAPLQS